MHVIGLVLVFGAPELQVQEGHTGGQQEGRIEHARAYMEADELVAISGVFRSAKGHGLAQALGPWRENKVYSAASTAAAGVCEEAGSNAVGDE